MHIKKIGKVYLLLLSEFPHSQQNSAIECLQQIDEKM
jgi:hypothetical protein